jgi:chromosome segregation ATPase
VIGLGGRATTTNRGKGIASFIKSGESQAKIITKICNNNKLGFGKVGFNVNEYGKSIIIERTLYSSGSSSYKMKSANGRVIADRKEVLDDIMRHFNIQVDNPICVLNQEVSRNFLNTKNPRDKYTFFMKATLLEDMKNDYATSETDRSISTKLLDNKMKIIPETTKDVKTLERKVKMFNDLVNHKERFAKLNNEALWALVNEEKQELKKLEKQVSKYKDKIDAEMAKVVEEKEKVAELESDKNEKLRRIENLVQDVENAHLLYDECKKRCDALREDYKKKESDERKIKAELSVIISDKRHLEQKIEDLEQQFRYLFVSF